MKGLQISKIPEVPRICPRCGCEKFYHLSTSRLKGFKLFSCAKCRKQFSSLTGTKFAGCHLRPEQLNEAITVFNESDGQISGKALERCLGVSYKASFYLLLKLCEMAGIQRESKSSGPGPRKMRSHQYFQSLKLREQRRKALVFSILDSGGTKSLEEIAGSVAPNHPLESCSLLVNSARKWRWLDGNIFYESIPQIIVRHTAQVRPVYERPNIENERETEIPMIQRWRNVVSLDAPVFNYQNGHQYFSSESQTPLEILMMKEEMESEEWQERERRLVEWRKFEQRNRSAFKELIQ